MPSGLDSDSIRGLVSYLRPNWPAWLLLTLVVAAAAAACGASHDALDSSQEAAVVESVQQTFQEYARLQKVGDTKGVLLFYADDPRFSWVEDGVERYTSRADVAKALAQLEGFGKVVTTYETPRVTVFTPELAQLFTTHTTTIGDPTQGGFSFSGAATITVVRSEDGWKFLKGHVSTLRQRGG